MFPWYPMMLHDGVLRPFQPAFPSKKQRKQHLLVFVCPVDEGELAKTYAD